MQKSIAFFDFDGTITRKDTMLELARYTSGFTRYWTGLFLISPWLIAMKMGLLSKTKAKEKFLSWYFKNKELEKFNSACEQFASTIIPRLVRPDALAAIQRHQAENTEVVIVSASAENWVAPWCNRNNIRYICSKLEVSEQLITGRLQGPNCNGPEKVSRIKEQFDTAEYSFIYCYGDTSGDKAMLQLATHPFYREFEK